MNFMKTVRWEKLLRELRVAVPTLRVTDDPRTAPVPTLYVDTDDASGGLFLNPPPGASPEILAALAAVVAAHDPASPDAFETTDDGDRADLAAFPSRAQIVTALSNLTADLVTLGAAPNNAQLAAILTRTLVNQRAIIRALATLVRRG